MRSVKHSDRGGIVVVRREARGAAGGSEDDDGFVVGDSRFQFLVDRHRTLLAWWRSGPRAHCTTRTAIYQSTVAKIPLVKSLTHHGSGFGHFFGLPNRDKEKTFEGERRQCSMNERR
jgi:hypothetical protein